jgi:hypothetical protein
VVGSVELVREMRSSYKILVGKRKNETFGRTEVDENIKSNLKEMDWEYVG